MTGQDHAREPVRQIPSLTALQVGKRLDSSALGSYFESVADFRRANEKI